MTCLLQGIRNRENCGQAQFADEGDNKAHSSTVWLYKWKIECKQATANCAAQKQQTKQARASRRLGQLKSRTTRRNSLAASERTAEVGSLPPADANMDTQLLVLRLANKTLLQVRITPSDCSLNCCNDPSCNPVPAFWAGWIVLFMRDTYDAQRALPSGWGLSTF